MLQAVEHIRRMRGGAQGHLMRCSDGGYYIVKFQNNPQHLRILVNEMLGSRLAARMGLPVPRTEVVEVTRDLIALSRQIEEVVELLAPSPLLSALAPNEPTAMCSEPAMPMPLSGLSSSSGTWWATPALSVKSASAL